MVRKSLGIPTVKWNYDQSAVVAVLHLSEVSMISYCDAQFNQFYMLLKTHTMNALLQYFITYLLNICVDSPQKTMLPGKGSSQQALLQCYRYCIICMGFFFLLNRHRNVRNIHVLVTTAFRHDELTGVVHQPPAGRRAAGAGRGELCGCYQLCLRKSLQLSPRWSVYSLTRVANM